MSPPKSAYNLPNELHGSVVREDHIEYGFIGRLQRLKYEYRPDITDRASLEKNFREKFEDLNRVRLTDGEFARLLDEIITPDVFAAAKTLRQINAFTRDDGTPLNYTLVNIKDWCKNTFEVISQLRINTDNSHHRYDVIILINGVPCVQVELKTLTINPRRAMEQIVDYKNDPGNGYSKTLLCFLQLFIVTISSALWIIVRILKNSPASYSRGLEVATQWRLDRLLADTAYDNDNSDLKFDEKLEVRRVSSILAAALLAHYSSRSLPVPEVVKKWREACLSPNEFPEIRHPWKTIN